MADEATVLEEVMDNLKEAGQRIRATQSLLRSQGMTDGENHRDLLTRLSTALAMTEAAYLKARCVLRGGSCRHSMIEARRLWWSYISSLQEVSRSYSWKENNHEEALGESVDHPGWRL
jgi:hypothetical protein